MKKITGLLLVLTMVVSLSGCGKLIGNMDLNKGQSAIYIKDGEEVEYAVCESFDKNYFNEDKLKSKIDEEIKDYNGSEEASVDDAIELENFKVKDKVATLSMSFATDYDFMKYVHEYNNISNEEFYIGNIKDNTDCVIEGKFVTPDKKSSVDEEKIQGLDKKILIVKDEYKVQVDGSVQYISENCSVNDDGIVTTGKSSTGLSYIIYSSEDK